jgi:hypothetical protein
MARPSGDRSDISREKSVVSILLYVLSRSAFASERHSRIPRSAAIDSRNSLASYSCTSDHINDPCPAVVTPGGNFEFTTSTTNAVAPRRLNCGGEISFAPSVFVRDESSLSHHERLNCVPGQFRESSLTIPIGHRTVSLTSCSFHRHLFDTLHLLSRYRAN